MFAICIESSHSRGMGHLFRALNLIEFLKVEKIPYIIFINQDEKAISILENKSVLFKVVDLYDYDSEWEKWLINQYEIMIWVNDRLNTDIRHTQHIKDANIHLITFDDQGLGAALADLNISALVFNNTDQLLGNKVLTGVEYLVLNREIDRYKRLRRKCEKIIVTLGGSDTYGVTIKVMNLLKKYKKKATIIVGPSFSHMSLLEETRSAIFTIKYGVPSLIKEFSEYDLAITGGGITPFEANASGLPCIVIANEFHEIEIGMQLETMGCSIFAGYYKSIDEEVFAKELEIEKMSEKGMELIKTTALERIYKEIMKC